MAKAAKTICVRRTCKKEIQNYGPAKKRCKCAKRVSIHSAEGRAANKVGFCVTKGKKRDACFRTKAQAKRHAAKLRKRCKSKVNVVKK